MSENSRLTGIELNGIFYSFGKSIYEELDVSLERFAELLGRDLYCPTLDAPPTSTTRTYTDTDGSENTFQIGQPCRWVEGNEYRIAVCKDITDSESDWHVLPTKLSEFTDDMGVLVKGNQTLTDAEKLQVKKNIGLDKGLLAYFPTLSISDQMELTVTAEDTVSVDMFKYDEVTGNLIFNYV